MNSTPRIVPQKALAGTIECFAEELLMLRSLFDAANEFDDWDLAADAMDTLQQTAWGMFAVLNNLDTLRCPVAAPEETIVRPGVYFC